jgi:hypothetical protein
MQFLDYRMTSPEIVCDCGQRWEGKIATQKAVAHVLINHVFEEDRQNREKCKDRIRLMLSPNPLED